MSSVLGVSFAISLTITALYIFLGWVQTTYGYNEFFLKWVLFPILTYIVSLSVSSSLQLLLCKKLAIQQVALTSLILPGAVLFSLFLTLFAFVRSPIELIVPFEQRGTQGSMLAVAFYTFWITMIAGTFHASFTTAC